MVGRGGKAAPPQRKGNGNATQKKGKTAAPQRRRGRVAPPKRREKAAPHQRTKKLVRRHREDKCGKQRQSDLYFSGETKKNKNSTEPRRIHEKASHATGCDGLFSTKRPRITTHDAQGTVNHQGLPAPRLWRTPHLVNTVRLRKTCRAGAARPGTFAVPVNTVR